MRESVMYANLLSHTVSKLQSDMHYSGNYFTQHVAFCITVLECFFCLFVFMLVHYYS